jgi:excisionase family DNA binding protein
MAKIEVTVTSPGYWADHFRQLIPLLSAGMAVIPDPTGRPPDPALLTVISCPDEWAAIPQELADALRAASLGDRELPLVEPASTSKSGAVGPVEDRLIYTVTEAAALLGISRSFAYEAVERGDIPSMRIGRRILVPKAALTRLLEAPGAIGAPDSDQ